MVDWILRACFAVVLMGFQNCHGQSGTISSKPQNKDLQPAASQVQERPEQKGEKKMENPEEKNVPILVVSFDSTEKALVVDYKVQNNTKSTIYLFNVLYEWDSSGQPTADQHGVYACLTDNGMLHLAKQIMPLPLLKKVEIRRVPFATRLEPGAEFREKVDVALPVEEYNPYFQKRLDSEIEPRVASSVYFSVQFIRASDELKVNPSGMGDSFSVWHPSIFAAVETIRSDVKPSAVRVNKRLDSFEGF